MNLYKCKGCGLVYYNYKIICDKCKGQVHYVSMSRFNKK